MSERLPTFGESPYYNILVPWLRVSHAADGTLQGGGNGVHLTYGTVDSINGQNNLITHKIDITSSGSTNQQLGVWIDMASIAGLGTGGNFRIPLAVRVQTGGGTGAGTGEGLRALNLIGIQNSADTQATVALCEGTLNNNKADVGANPAASQVLVGFSAGSSGSFPGTDAFVVGGTGKWWRGLLISQGGIVAGGNAIDYSGDGTHGAFQVSAEARVTIGNASTTDPALIVGNGLQVTAGILHVGTTVTTSASSGYIVLANNKALSSVDSAGTGTRELIRMSGSNVIHINPSADSVIAMGVPASVGSAGTGDVVIAKTKAFRTANNAGSGTYTLIRGDASDRVQLAPDGGDILWGRALVALGAGGAATLGQIGGAGPATAAQNTWMRAIDSAGNAFWVPVWK